MTSPIKTSVQNKYRELHYSVSFKIQMYDSILRRADAATVVQGVFSSRSVCTEIAKAASPENVD